MVSPLDHSPGAIVHLHAQNQPSLASTYRDILNPSRCNRPAMITTVSFLFSPFSASYCKFFFRYATLLPAYGLDLSFAALAWCMVSSCLGQSCLDALRDLWRLLVLSAQSNRRPGPAGYRRHIDDQSDFYEMENRGIGRAG